MTYISFWQIAMRLSFLWLIGVEASKRKKTKVGTDIHLKDTYHPWSEDVEDTPSSSQHIVGEYMLSAIKGGDSIDTAIEKLEAFSTSKHLGMTLGNAKGQIIEEAIANNISGEHDSYVFIELGSHIGDGTLRILRQLNTASRPFKNCVVLSLEANQEWLGIGSNIVRHVVRNGGCRYVPMALTDDVTHIMTHIKHLIKAELNIESVSGVFLDHNHAKFNRDISIMHEEGLLREGTLIIADNALRHKKVMNNFIEDMRRTGKNFKLVPVSDPYPDEILLVEWNKPNISNQHDSGEL